MSQRRVLIKFRHGLGDAIQLTSVLGHLKFYYPDWDLTIWVGHGKHSALRSFGTVVTSDPKSKFDAVYDLDWWECDRCFRNTPSTKAELCLTNVFKLEPLPELAHYTVPVSEHAMGAARGYLTSIGATEAAGRFNVALLHYEGNTSTAEKNLSLETAAVICATIKRNGLIPVILDWDDRSRLPDQKTIFCPSKRHPIWDGHGTGDADTIAALIKQSAIFIGIDSGPQKVAMSTDTPTVAIWVRMFPAHYSIPTENTIHLCPPDIERHAKGPEAVEFFKSRYRHATYQSDQEICRTIESVLGKPDSAASASEAQSTLVAFSFCGLHLKSAGGSVASHDHYQMLQAAIDTCNPHRLPTLISAIEWSASEATSVWLRDGVSIVSGPNLGHQHGAYVAIKQAVTFANEHGYRYLAFFGDDTTPMKLGLAERMVDRLKNEGIVYVGSRWGTTGFEINTQVFACDVPVVASILPQSPELNLHLEAEMYSWLTGAGLRFALDGPQSDVDYFHSHDPVRFLAAARGAMGETSIEENNTGLGRALNAMGSDKNTTHSYGPIYDSILSDRRQCELPVLEIGIAGGGSLRAWRDHFERALIHGIDIDPGRMIENEPRIQTHCLSQRHAPGLSEFGKLHGRFQVIIDDGSHDMLDILISHSVLWQFVAPGGFYVIEDLRGDDAEMFRSWVGATVHDLREVKHRYDDIIVVIRKEAA